MKKIKNKEESVFAKSSDKPVFLDILSKTGSGFKFIFKSGIISIFIMIILDQLTKQLAQYFLVYERASVTAIPKLLSFTLVYNNGAAWNSMAGNRVFLIGISLVCGIAMILGLFFYFNRIPWVAKAGLYMMIGGCFGNFIDRAFYPDGLVVDFIQFDWFFGFDNFPVCNLADVFLVCGIAVLVIGVIIVLIVEEVNRKKRLQQIDGNTSTTSTNENSEENAANSTIKSTNEDDADLLSALKDLYKQEDLKPTENKGDAEVDNSQKPSEIPTESGENNEKDNSK